MNLNHASLRLLAFVSVCFLWPGLGTAQPNSPTPVVWPALDRVMDRAQAIVPPADLPISLGAWHWWHADRDGKFRYGDVGAEGTFFYFLKLDPVHELSTTPYRNAGLHIEARFNDGDKFRGFFDSHLWLYETYAWVYSEYGTLKLGKIWKRFGQDWDGSFWGGTGYYDGFKLNADWGISWERPFQLSPETSLQTFVQFFVADDGTNGALSFADAEGVPGLSRRNVGLVRGLLSHQITAPWGIDLGISAEAGHVKSNRTDFGSHNIWGWAVDVGTRYRWDNGNEIHVFGEWMESQGARSPFRYVSGGPSERIVNTTTGVELTRGPVTVRSLYSTGEDFDPGGRQHISLHGISVNLTKSIDLYLERVRWKVRPDYTTRTQIYNDGWELVLSWSL